MSFESRGEAVVAAHDENELKLIYCVLHRHLAEHPDLMDTHFLTELQGFLQRQAQAAGVDVAHHGDWDRWLGNESVACDARIARRRVIV